MQVERNELIRGLSKFAIFLMVVFYLSYLWAGLSKAAPSSIISSATQIFSNPSPEAINAKIEELAKTYKVPPIIIKAIAWKESSWRQFNSATASKQDRRACKANDHVTLRREPDGRCGYGLMQVTVYPDDPRVSQLQADWKYNLKIGVEHLVQKWTNSIRGIESLEGFTLYDKDSAVLENWFYAVAWYNGSGSQAYNYVSCIYRIVKGLWWDTDNCQTPPSSLKDYFSTHPDITFSPDVKSTLRGPIKERPRCPIECYTLKELAKLGGKIHKWDWSQNAYIDITNDILNERIIKERTATVLVMDVSGSMGQSWKGGIKLESAKKAAQRTIDLIEHEIRTTGNAHHIAIVTFSDDVNRILHLTPDYDRARQFIISLGTIAWTNLGAGLLTALQELNTLPSTAQRFIILLSDGMTNRGLTREQILSGPVAEARRNRICIHTIGFGDPGDIDEDFLRKIASGSGCGVYSYAGSGFELMNVYIKLRHISLGQLAGEFSSLSSQSTRVNLLTGMTATLGTVYVPERQQALYFTLTWSDGRLQARLIDPAGREVTASYPGVQMRYFDQMVNIILSRPQSGWWTVAAYGERVPLRGTEYYAIVSTRPGGLAIPIALPKICIKIDDETICPAPPGIIPPWLIITISVVVLLLVVYLRLSEGGI